MPIILEISAGNTAVVHNRTRDTPTNSVTAIVAPTHLPKLKLPKAPPGFTLISCSAMVAQMVDEIPMIDGEPASEQNDNRSTSCIGAGNAAETHVLFCSFALMHVGRAMRRNKLL